MRVLIEMVDAIGVEKRAAPLYAVDDVAFLQEQFGRHTGGIIKRQRRPRLGT